MTPDVPYLITDPLPAIFSSQLFHHTKPINFLSNSLPRLDSICWGKAADSFDNLAELAEEALNKQYDQDIKYFYLEKRERTRSERMSNKSNDCNMNMVGQPFSKD